MKHPVITAEISDQLELELEYLASERFRLENIYCFNPDSAST